MTQKRYENEADLVEIELTTMNATTNETQPAKPIHTDVDDLELRLAVTQKNLDFQKTVIIDATTQLQKSTPALTQQLTRLLEVNRSLYANQFSVAFYEHNYRRTIPTALREQNTAFVKAVEQKQAVEKQLTELKAYYHALAALEDALQKKADMPAHVHTAVRELIQYIQEQKAKRLTAELITALTQTQKLFVDNEDKSIGFKTDSDYRLFVDRVSGGIDRDFLDFGLIMMILGFDPLFLVGIMLISQSFALPLIITGLAVMALGFAMVTLANQRTGLSEKMANVSTVVSHVRYCDAIMARVKTYQANHLEMAEAITRITAHFETLKTDKKSLPQLRTLMEKFERFLIHGNERANAVRNHPLMRNGKNANALQSAISQIVAQKVAIAEENHYKAHYVKFTNALLSYPHYKDHVVTICDEIERLKTTGEMSTPELSALLNRATQMIYQGYVPKKTTGFFATEPTTPETTIEKALAALGDKISHRVPVQQPNTSNASEEERFSAAVAGFAA